jgi:hypothetical protein
MRRINLKIVITTKNVILFLLVLSILSCFFTIKDCYAQGEEILIYTTDTDDNYITEIIEGESFKISVYDPDLEVDMFLVNVTIDFNDKLYNITESTPNKEITILAPEVNFDKEFTIRAYKDQLYSETTITVLNKPELVITPQELIVDADTDFYVIVTEETSQGDPVYGATVYISSIHDQEDSTNENGIVYLHSPENREQIRIIAQKEGYETSYVDIRINQPRTIIQDLLKNEYFLFTLAFVILISVVIYVHLRQKKSIYVRTKEITEEKLKEKDEGKNNTDDFSTKKEYFPSKSSYMEAVRAKSNNSPKVEEIRISRERKEKEIVPIKAEEDKTEKVLSKRARRQNKDWFKGKDDIRYEIDKITGEIDEEGKDKWFEGVDSIREKIDKKVKKDKKDQEED